MTECAGGCVYPGEHQVACERGEACTGCLPVPGDPFWCEGCRGRLGELVAALPGLAHDVAARRDGMLAPSGRAERAGASPDPASLSPGFDGFDEVVQWACAWEDVFRRLLGDSTPQEPSWTARRGRALSGACRWLYARRDAVLGCDSYASVDFGRELGELTRRVERGAGVDRLVHHLPLPCLRCDRLALVRRDGSETVQCRACQGRWAWDDYDRLAGAYAHVARQET